PRRRSIDLDVVVDSEVERLREETGTRVDMTGVSARLVDADQPQMARLVRNLLNNAARHARQRVTIALKQDDGVVRLVVEDDGSGVPEHDRERIFDRFTRLDEARTASTGGTGLGLAIARDIAVAHGGSIRCETALGGGARFVVELPAVEEGET
ncbi:MAG: sensor histidine kinase, partial [Acidimicrobiales bacterium]